MKIPDAKQQTVTLNGRENALGLSRTGQPGKTTNQRPSKPGIIPSLTSRSLEDELTHELYNTRIARVSQSVISADVGGNRTKNTRVQRADCRGSSVAIQQIRKIEELGPNLERHLFPHL